jgi:hypothetical protein
MDAHIRKSPSFIAGFALGEGMMPTSSIISKKYYLVEHAAVDFWDGTALALNLGESRVKRDLVLFEIESRFKHLLFNDKCREKFFSRLTHKTDLKTLQWALDLCPNYTKWRRPGMTPAECQIELIVKCLHNPNLKSDGSYVNLISTLLDETGVSPAPYLVLQTVLQGDLRALKYCVDVQKYDINRQQPQQGVFIPEDYDFLEIALREGHHEIYEFILSRAPNKLLLLCHSVRRLSKGLLGNDPIHAQNSTKSTG